ncbi:golgin subfamily A member 6-like protein 7 [Nylanderia fulva]|uniref:golgin subfamily A member 6-like protein 7 n=1 Tax=Nylanderia fulva TaxID=613905 RepID=UPI0010FBB46F|nr:golgin subfamily A member 6-like protein 7 [Nylanderia fulva]
MKRKKRELEEKTGEGSGEIFKRSNKTTRSPEKGGEEDGEKEEIKRLLQDMWQEMREIREEIKEQGERIRGEMEEIRRDYKIQMERWKREKKEMIENMEGMKRRIEGLERKMEEKEEGERKKRAHREWFTEESRGNGKEMGDIRKRGKKKEYSNKRLISQRGEKKRGSRKIVRGDRGRARIMKIRKIGEDREMGREMVVVELEKEEQKWEVMEKKKRLKGRKERIDTDLTWKEREIRRKLGEIARREEKRGERTWVSNGKLKIGEKWWRWDEEKEVLRDEKGNVKNMIMREEERRKEDGLK